MTMENGEFPSCLDVRLFEAVINQVEYTEVLPAYVMARMIVDHDNEHHITTLEIVYFPEKKINRRTAVNEFRAVKVSSLVTAVIKRFVLMISDRDIKARQRQNLLRDVVRKLFASIIFLKGNYACNVSLY